MNVLTARSYSTLLKCNTHDKKEKCQICYKKVVIFKGGNAVENFGQWLINDQH